MRPCVAAPAISSDLTQEVHVLGLAGLERLGVTFWAVPVGTADGLGNTRTASG